MSRSIMGTLAGIIFLRVLGITLLLAGFIDHATRLGGSVAAAGFAFGAYPFALALFMLPLGAWSDRIGRRPVLVGGLLVSAAGALLAAVAPSTLLFGVGRFIQGAGAINAVALTLAAETGAPDMRTRRMAVLGASAGGAAILGLLLGAWLTPMITVPGLLVLQVVASLALIVPVMRLIPSGPPPHSPVSNVATPAGVTWLAVAAFGVNLSMMGLLFLSPRLVASIAPDATYGVVLTAMLIPGGLGMFLAARLADKGHARAVGWGAALLLGAAPLAFLGEPMLWALVVAGMAYFIGQSALTSLIPSITAHVSPEGRGGRAQGLVSTLQSLGSAAGASVAGLLYPSRPDLAVMFLLAGVVVAIAIGLTARGTAPSGAPTKGI